MRHAIAGLMLAACATAAGVSAQTREIVGGPRVQSRLRLQWDPATGRILLAVDEDPVFRPLVMSETFLTDRGLVITYPRLNPLRIDVMAALSGAGNAPSGTVAARLRALLALATITPPARSVPSDRPPVGATEPAAGLCAALSTARADAEGLVARVAGTPDAPTVAALVVSWRQAIDAAFSAGQGGSAAVSAAVARIDQFLSDLGTRLRDIEPIVMRVEAQTEAAAPADACQASARAVYDTLRLANPRARLVQFLTVQAAVLALRQALARDYAPADARWQGAEYRVGSEIQPGDGSPLTVVVRMTHFAFEADGSSGALVASEETSGSGAFVTQRFSRFAREFAVGTVISTITPPHYGTTTNEAGQTVVAMLDEEATSVSAGLLASFVCRCATGPFVAPMLQAGITTSEETPAFLAGGGVRLFGLPKGDVAVGAGWMMAWVQDLRSLTVGDPVGGTRDIDADLRRVRRHGFYFSLQYKF